MVLVFWYNTAKWGGSRKNDQVRGIEQQPYYWSSTCYYLHELSTNPRTNTTKRCISKRRVVWWYYRPHPPSCSLGGGVSQEMWSRGGGVEGDCSGKRKKNLAKKKKKKKKKRERDRDRENRVIIENVFILQNRKENENANENGARHEGRVKRNAYAHEKRNGDGRVRLGGYVECDGHQTMHDPKTTLHRRGQWDTDDTSCVVPARCHHAARVWWSVRETGALHRH